MRKIQFFLRGVIVAACVSGSLHAQLSDVTQPGDPIIASSSRSPGSEGVANAIDNQPTKYLNFDSGQGGFIPSGFVVSPAVGNTHVTGIALTSANDAPERDPRAFTLEGSNDDTIGAFNSGNWTVITAVSNITPWPAIFGDGVTNRFKTQRFTFPNPKAYRHYRWIVVETQTTPNGCCMQIAEVELLGTTLPRDVTQPGDTIFASSSRSPGSEGVANAIDNQPTKYLNFDSGQGGFIPSGFAVSPSIGRTLVNAISMQSANDAPERDPRTITLEGSNDPTLTGYGSVTWEPITTINNIPAWPTIFGGGNTNRFKTQTFFFDNPKPYRHYRWVVTETQTTPNGCCMQIAEVELLGTSAPRDVTQPGDPIFASSSRSPGSEGVANAIDDQPTKYLNFDSGQGGFIPSGFAVSPRVGATTVIGLTMQSANDAPERDPRAVTLEGSNDDSLSSFSSGTWELITAISNIPSWPSIFGDGVTNRFKTQEFFFLNTKPYKHYRWIVTETQTTPNGCCMQIAEVELLAVPQAGNTNIIDTLIRRQPTDTPVLLGQQATFRVLLTGPWNVQWFKNGVAIPGATAPSYTTPAATAADDGALFKAVVSSPQGTQVSDEAMLSIFTPSTTESIGLSWRGGGANGAPTDLFPQDITGFHPQAYWNNLGGETGTRPSPQNSSNAPHPTITVQWMTTGEWGVGTGNSDPLERMFNGVVGWNDVDAGASDRSVTLSGVPQGNHTIYLYTVQVPLEFFNMDFAVVTHDAGGADVIQQRYIRPLNADEYNPSPGFSLVTSDTPETREVGNMMRFDNLQPGPDGTIQIRFSSPGRVDLPGGQPIRGPGLNAMQLVLNAPNQGAPPVITRQPASANAIAGGCITLCVEATGPGLTYQWLKNGQPIAGATNICFSLANLSTNSAGNYAVAVSNPAGRVRSRTAVVDVVGSAQITLGLISYFKLNDGGADGFTAANSAPGGQNGQIQGSFADFTPGQVGNGLIFDQSFENRVFVANYPKVSRAITVSGWVQSFSPEWGPIINNWVEANTGASGQFQVEVVLENGVPTLKAQIEVGPNRVFTSVDIEGSLFTWHHFAMTANGVTLSIYWDGRLVGAVDYLGSINTTPSLPWLSIGANLNADTTVLGSLFGGVMDDLAVWNRSLSGSEIQGIYSAGLSGNDVSMTPPVLTVGSCPPTITCSSNIVVECTGGLTPVTYTVTAVDVSGAPVSVVCVPPSGSGFRLGQSNVICTATSGSAAASCSFRVTVVDTAPPTLTCPTNQTVQATGPDGAVINYSAGAFDACGIADFSCVPPPGSTFPVGTTAVVCTASDPSGNSNSCSFTFTVLPSNRCPTANPLNVAVNQDSAVNFQLTGSDPEGDPLQFIVTQGPAHGTVVVQAQTGAASYAPAAGYCGPDSFRFKVNDGRCGDSPEATVLIAVACITNLPPVADASATDLLVISPNGSNAVVTLDGTRSSDPDGDPLTYLWLEGAVQIAAGAVANATLPVGQHNITLTVNDGLASDSDTILIQIVTPGEAVEMLATTVDGIDLGRKNKRPLIASLKAVVASFDRGNFSAAVNQLQAFQHKILAQVEDEALAASLIEAAQAVIDAVQGP